MESSMSTSSNAAANLNCLALGGNSLWLGAVVAFSVMLSSTQDCFIQLGMFFLTAVFSIVGTGLFVIDLILPKRSSSISWSQILRILLPVCLTVLTAGGVGYMIIYGITHLQFTF